MFKPHLDVKFDKVATDAVGRVIAIDCTVFSYAFRCISVYAPDGPSERKMFFNSKFILPYVHTSLPIAMGGDNCIFESRTF